MKKQRLLRSIGLPIQYAGNVFLMVFFLLMTQSYNAQTNKAVIKGGEIGTKDNTTICLNGNSQPIDVYLEGAAGDLQQWIITDYDNNILGLPKAPPFSFEGAGPGICKIWSVSYKDIFNLEKGVNLSDLEGWYELSNYIQITRNQPEGGTLSGGPFEFTVGDGEADNIYEGAITLEGNSGANSQWVVTDDQGNILGLPPSPYVVDFDGAGEGVCLVWHLSFDGEITGAEVGNNASDIAGCYSLSNSVKVIRKANDNGGDNGDGECEVNGGKLKPGGLYLFCEGDGINDYAEGISLEQNEGDYSQWVITDAEGNILGLPPTPDQVNFDVAGPGVCLIWHLSFSGEIYGANEGSNAFTDLKGCYDLSNPIPVFRFPSDSGLCDILIYSGQQLSNKDLSETNISMYPNPANHNVNIDLSNSLLEDVTVRIHSYTGSEVYNKSINLTSDKLVNVDVSELSQGLYLISITNNADNSIKTVKKLLVE